MKNGLKQETNKEIRSKYNFLKALCIAVLQFGKKQFEYQKNIK